MKNVHGTIWLMAILLALNLNAAERKSALWGDLEPGPYAVGFKLVTVLDHSRIFHSNAAFPWWFSVKGFITNLHLPR